MIVHKPYDSSERAAFSYGLYLFVDAYVYPDPYDPKDAIDSVFYIERHTDLGQPVTRNWNMQNDSGSRWRVATLLQPDPGTDVTYEIVAKNKQGITRHLPTYLLYHREGDQAVAGPGAMRLAVSPNPAIDKLSLQVPSISREVEVEIVNAFGAVVKRALLNGREVTLDIHELPAGHYILHAEHTEFSDASFVIVR
jgi:hypothetical protein